MGIQGLRIQGPGTQRSSSVALSFNDKIQLTCSKLKCTAVSLWVTESILVYTQQMLFTPDGAI